MKHRRIIKIILFVILYSLVPMISLILYMNLGQREQSLRTAKIEAENKLNTIVTIEHELMSKTEAFLFTLSKVDEIHNFNLKLCNRLLPQLLTEFKYFKNIAVSDLQGNLICSAVPSKQLVNVSDRKYFKNTVTYRRFSLGDYNIGRIVKVPVWIAGYPILTDDGVLKGAVGVSISLDWLNKFLLTQSLPPGSTLKVFDEKGIILLSYPDSSIIGKNRATDSEINYILKGNSSPVVLKESDNIKRLFVYSTLQPTSSDEIKHILIGIPESSINKPADDAFKRNLILSLVIVSVVFIIVFINWKLFIISELKD